MKVVVLYHPNSEHSGVVEDYAKEYKRFHGRDIELVSLETIKGAELAKLYDATVYPATVALDNNGSLLHIWQGPRLPLMNDVDSYFQQ